MAQNKENSFPKKQSWKSFPNSKKTSRLANYKNDCTYYTGTGIGGVTTNFPVSH
jgi:hypothetical protein